METLLMIIGIPVIIAIVAVAPKYFKTSPVEINKEASTVEKKVFDKKLPPAEVGKEESTTVYQYVCEPELEAEIADENQVSRNKWQVRATITRARVTLKLPITVWLSQTVQNRRADFEDGHVQVCQRVFVDAHEAASAACHRVIGRTFYGEGGTLEQAKANAIEIAKQELRAQYLQAVDTKAKDVLMIYDFYAPKWRKPADVLVDKALQEYEVGKPRKIRRITGAGSGAPKADETSETRGANVPSNQSVNAGSEHPNGDADASTH